MSLPRNRSVLYLSLMVFLSFFALHPLFNPFIFSGHDMPAHIARCVELKYSLSQGLLYPRIFTNLCYGYSTPILNFQSPLFYYAVSFVDLFIDNIATAMKFILGLCFILSGIFMYQLVRYLWGEKAGFIAGLLYMYTPYHISQLYVRASLTEFFAITLFPLLMLKFLQYLKEKTTINFVLSSFLIAILMLSHNPMALIFPAFLAAFFFYKSMMEKNFKIFLDFLKPVFAGLMLSAFFLVPAIFEKGYVNLSKLLQWISDYNMHFVYFHQFFSPFWGCGYSFPGASDGMSFQLGFFNITAVIFTFLMINRFKKKDKSFIIFVVASFFVSIYLMMFRSSIVWEYCPFLAYIQYPWRFLALTGFLGSILMGSVISILFPRENGVSERPYIFLLGILIIIAIMPYLKDIKYDKESMMHTTIERIRYSGGTSSFRDEYLPVWVIEKPAMIFKDKVEPRSTNTSVSGKSIKPLDIEFSADTPDNDGLIRINTFYFPGWEATMDGKETQILYEGQYNGIMHVEAPRGNHRFRIWYKGTLCQRICTWLSTLTLIFLLLYMLVKVIKKPEPVNENR